MESSVDDLSKLSMFVLLLHTSLTTPLTQFSILLIFIVKDVMKADKGERVAVGTKICAL